MLLIQLLFGLALLGVGGNLVVSGVRSRSKGRVVGGSMVLVAFLVLSAPMCLHMAAVSGIEWNPLVSRSFVVGAWGDDDSTLTLREDGTFLLRAEGEAAKRFGASSASGSWSLNDWNLTLAPSDAEALHLRVVGRGNGYRIIEQPGDLDGWRAWGGLSQNDG